MMMLLANIVRLRTIKTMEGEGEGEGEGTSFFLSIKGKRDPQNVEELLQLTIEHSCVVC